MFGVFLFLTYYLQTTLHFSPVESGLAFLPMMATVMTDRDARRRSKPASRASGRGRW